jgi:Putative beta-lactamase-inhibitor-like, PepSY-like
MNALVRFVASVAMFAILISAAAAQEKIEADKLPQKVKDALKARFPGSMVTQATKEMENGEVIYDIEMTVGGKKHEMDCKEDGTIVDIQNEIDAKDLPAAALNAIKAKYPGSTIKEVGEILVVKDKKETRDHFEVIIETADKKEMELTVSLDGSKIE